MATDRFIVSARLRVSPSKFLVATAEDIMIRSGRFFLIHQAETEEKEEKRSTGTQPRRGPGRNELNRREGRAGR